MIPPPGSQVDCEMVVVEEVRRTRKDFSEES